MCPWLGGKAQESPQVSLDFLDNMEVASGVPVTVKAKFTSIGPDASISSFDFEFTVDGDLQQATHVNPAAAGDNLQASASGTECEFAFTIPAFEEVGEHEALLKITKLNDREITKNRGSAKCDFTIKVLTPGFPRTMAIEEYTGVWCGYCPSGWVALEAMSRIFGDRVVCLAYHSDDIMTSNVNYPEYVPSLPYMRLNRNNRVYVTNIEDEINKSLAVDARAKIDVKAEWATPEGLGINITADVVTADPVADDGYRIAYVVLHNDMRGSGKEWYQTDYGQRDLPAYPEWNYLGGYLWYNDVVFDGTDMKGLENSVPALEAGGTHQHTYSIDMGKHVRPVVQNKKNLQVAALLVSKVDNKIVNAAKCDIYADPSWPLDGKFGSSAGTDPDDPVVDPDDPVVDPDDPVIDPDDPSGVSSVEGENAADVHYYNLDGIEIKGTPAPGLYLRRQGSKVTKVVVTGNIR